MFTGIITDVGTVRAVSPIGAGADMRLVIGTAWPDAGAVPIGASVACSGCCLTVVERGADWLAFEASAETLSKTALGAWAPGTRVNLERALRMGDELGGHMVSGHVDGLGRIVAVTPENGSTRLSLELPASLARFIAPKGSVAVDGVSLTVNEAHKGGFGVNVIPHTLAATTLGARRVGDAVHIEIDMLARYVARLAEAG